MNKILYVRISMPQSEVNVNEYLSDFSLAGTVTGRGNIALVCWANLTRSNRGNRPLQVIRNRVTLRRIWFTSDIFVPPSVSSIPKIIFPVVVSENIFFVYKIPQMI